MKNTAIVIEYILDEKSKSISQSIGQVVVEGSFLHFCYDQIGCNMVEVVQDEGGVDLWVDEEGLFNSGSPVISYMLNMVLAGNVVVTNGIDEEGGTVLFDPEDGRDRLRMAKIAKRLSQWSIVGVVE